MPDIDSQTRRRVGKTGLAVIDQAERSRDPIQQTTALFPRPGRGRGRLQDLRHDVVAGTRRIVGHQGLRGIHGA